MLKFTLSVGSIALLAGCATAPEVLPFEVMPVAAVTETDPMVGQGDRADDPAVWVNPADPEASLILGTNKDEGLHVYDLSGAELAFLDVGQVNNVDLRGNLAVASNDELNAMTWFVIDEATATVSHLGDTPVGRVEPYGICAGMVGGQYHAAVTYKDGVVQIWSVPQDGEGLITPVLAREVQLPSQLEGCAFDDAAARLFVGEEEAGIWVIELGDEGADPYALDTIADGNGLVADVEGLSLWEREDGTGYLIASAQSRDRFVVYDRTPPFAPRGIFTVSASADGTIDAVTHTDGLDVVSAPLPGYPQGLVVVQDDGNPVSGRDQNFKLVGWAEVAAALGLE